MATGRIVKQPAETFIVGVDFSELLASGETVTLAGSSVASTPLAGEDLTSIIVTDSLQVGAGATSLICRLEGGDLTVVRYKVSFRAATSAGNLYEHDVLVVMED